MSPRTRSSGYSIEQLFDMPRGAGPKREAICAGVLAHGMRIPEPGTIILPRKVDVARGTGYTRQAVSQAHSGGFNATIAQATGLEAVSNAAYVLLEKGTELLALSDAGSSDRFFPHPGDFDGVNDRPLTAKRVRKAVYTIGQCATGPVIVVPPFAVIAESADIEPDVLRRTAGSAAKSLEYATRLHAQRVGTVLYTANNMPQPLTPP